MRKAGGVFTRKGKILLLKNRDYGKIALAGKMCARAPNIIIRSDNLQHPKCIDFTLSDNRSFYACDFDPNIYSACYRADESPGDFTLKLRWKAGHTPYPEIKDMDVWVFGLYLGKISCPRAPDDYLSIAYIVIDSDRKIYVNGYLC